MWPCSEICQLSKRLGPKRQKLRKVPSRDNTFSKGNDRKTKQKARQQIRCWGWSKILQTRAIWINHTVTKKLEGEAQHKENSRQRYTGGSEACELRRQFGGEGKKRGLKCRTVVSSYRCKGEWPGKTKQIDKQWGKCSTCNRTEHNMVRGREWSNKIKAWKMLNHQFRNNTVWRIYWMQNITGIFDPKLVSRCGFLKFWTEKTDG